MAKTMGEIEREFRNELSKRGTQDMEVLLRHAIAEAFEATKTAEATSTKNSSNVYRGFCDGINTNRKAVAAAQKAFLGKE